MKKTIVALMALAGVVAAADYTANATWPTTGTVIEKMPTLADASGDLYWAVEGMKIDGKAVAFDSAAPKTNSVYAGVITPDTNVGNGGSWEMSFRITNRSETEAITLSSMTLDLFAYNSVGSAQSGDTYKRDINAALTTGNVTVSTVVSFGNDDNGDGTRTYNWDTNPTLTFDAPLELAAQSYASFTLSISESDSMGCYIGLSGITVSTPAAPAVPEPTTATLSLLAFAGLAARRRRK